MISAAEASLAANRPLPSGETPASAPRIALFTDDPDQGGVAQYNHAVLLELARLGCRATCIQPRSQSPLVASQAAAGVEHRWLPYETGGKNFARTLTDMATPKAIFESSRPDLVVFSDCCPVSNLAARHTAMALQIPFVVVVGFVAEYLVEDAKPYLAVIARHYGAAREVVAVSEENLGLLRSRFGLEPNRGTVIHYGRPSAYFAPTDPAARIRRRSELGIPPEAVVGLTSARMTPFKGYLHQIAAIERLGPSAPNHFIWLGDGEQRPALEREIARRNWQRRFTLPGHQWNVPEWCDLADLYILPSEHEGMPLSIMEAMAKALPVAASGVSGIPEELGPTGRLLPDPRTRREDAIRELSRTIELWTRDPDLRRRTGAACRERALELFREETMLSRTLDLLRVHLPRIRRDS
jgi:glycosyltransferase involved in cell wall biosynthesis